MQWKLPGAGGRFWLALAAAVVAAGSQARAQGAPGAVGGTPGAGLLPAYGTDIRVGDLRQQFERSFAGNPPVVSDRSWTFNPAIDISEAYDSGVQTSNGGFKSDFITRVTPILAGTVNTRSITGAWNYSPVIAFYAQNSSQNGVGQNFNGTTTVTAVEDLLYLDLRGFANTQEALGGVSSPGATSGQSNMVQTLNFAASPYLLKRFGDTATLRMGYEIARNVVNSLSPGGTAFVGGINQNYTSHQETFALGTGPEFGRIIASLQAVATQYQGVGLYDGAHNESASVTGGYALTRTLTVNASVGHENIVYGPGGPSTIKGVTWSGGVRWTPNADSVISTGYGHQEGASSFYFDGTYQPTARLRLAGRYSQGVGTGLQTLQSSLANVGVGPGGIAVDRTTGAPVSVNNYLGLQTGVYRTTLASASAALLLDRDTITLSALQTQQTLLSAPTAGTAAGNSNGFTGSLAWQHSVSEALSTSSVLQYGVRKYQSSSASTTVSGSLSVNYQVSELLSVNFLFSHSQTNGPSFGLPPTQDLVIIGLHRAFSTGAQ